MSKLVELTDEEKVSAPWWEDDGQVNELVLQWGLWYHQNEEMVQAARDAIRAAARKAVETHGHARGCVCHLECKHPAGQACGDRDPRCLEGAK
jgi:hypothetical protein